MSVHSEAIRLNLEYYRKSAKALLKAAQTGESEALDRLRRHSPQVDPVAPALHDAQLTIAREQGFASWPRFKTFIVQSNLDFQGLVDTFIQAAVSERRRADEILSANPAIEDAGFFVALVLGRADRVGEALSETPDLVNAKGGPNNWSPLAYICVSRYAAPQSPRANAIIETAQLLLERGADPNEPYIHEDFPDNPLPPLYAATGLNNHPALARVLLAAGAKPNDGESMYHAAEHPDLECLRLLLDSGGRATSTTLLHHMLDREDPEGVRLLLSRGAGPNQVNGHCGTALHWAVLGGRSKQIVAMLLDAGADINAKRLDGRTAYALAYQSGQKETCELLVSRGAKTDVPIIDYFVGLCADAKPEEIRAFVSGSGSPIEGRIDAKYSADEIRSVVSEARRNPLTAKVLPDLASSHRTDGVRGLLAAGFPVDARGHHGGTALHWACWKGYADIVKLLLDHGASLTIEDFAFEGTPPGWFGHGTQNCGECGGDYAEVARLLIAAGAEIPQRDLPTGRPDVDAVLLEHGLIEQMPSPG
jgi:ankyrin repeat protein